jgi:hypothetical protein
VPYQATFARANDLPEPLVIGVVVALDDVPADHARLLFVRGAVLARIGPQAQSFGRHPDRGVCHVLTAR